MHLANMLLSLAILGLAAGLGMEVGDDGKFLAQDGVLRL